MTDAQKRYLWVRRSWALLSVYVSVYLWWLVSKLYCHDLAEYSLGFTTVSVHSVLRFGSIMGIIGSATLAAIGPNNGVRLLSLLTFAVTLLTPGSPSFLAAVLLCFLAFGLEQQMGIERPKIPISGCALAVLIVLPPFWIFLSYAMVAFVVFHGIRCFPWLVFNWPPLPGAEVVHESDETETDSEQLEVVKSVTAAPQIEEEWEFDG